MPRTDSHSSGSGELHFENGRPSKRGPPERNDMSVLTEAESGTSAETPVPSQLPANMHARGQQAFGERDETHIQKLGVTTNLHYDVLDYHEPPQMHPQTNLPGLEVANFDERLSPQQSQPETFEDNQVPPTIPDYLSEDGTSLSDPRSSEAETEHILSDHEEDVASILAIDEDADENLEDVESEDENDVESLEAPDDLDNLSDIDSDDEEATGLNDMARDKVSRTADEIDVAEDMVEEQEDNTAISSPASEVSDVDAERDGADIMVSLGADNTNVMAQEEASQGPSSPPRKRKRSTETSPIATKRLAPRKVQADLDSDEEDESVSPKHALISAIIGQRDDNDNSQDNQIATPGNQSSISKDHGESPKVDEVVEEVEEEMAEDEEEPEEEVQDDTEREERNRHRQAAMDALRNIEIEFAHLRSKLYDERMSQIEREIALADQGEHPLLVEKASQNRSRHSGRLSRAEVLRDRRRAEAEIEFTAHKFIAHSQFAQDKQKLRATLLSRTSAEWFQIHREKRVLDMAVPEYGYLVPDRKSTQLKNRRDLEAEISNLSSLKKLIGFPAAPSISVASMKDIDADLADMGISRAQGSAAREHQRSSHTTLSSQLAHSQPSNTHIHQPQATSHGKVHQHRKKNQESKVLNSGQSDQNNTTPNQQSKTVSPQASNNQQFPNHSYQHDSGRKPNTMPTVYNTGPNHESERKPAMYSASSDTVKNREHDREQLPFPATGIPHMQSSAFNQTQLANGSVQFQKQAQNLPNILRQDTPDRNKGLPALSQLANGLPLNHDTIGSNSHGKSFTSKFWNSKMTDTNRQPAPAVSSNSAFNATLSQPGISAAYIPPKTYSPAAQTQNSVFKPSTSLQSMSQANTTSKNYPLSQHFAATVPHGKEVANDAAQLYKSQHHMPSENHRSIFSPVPPPPGPPIKQEQQHQHQ